MTFQSVLDGQRSWAIQQGDCLEVLRQMPDESVQCCVTSPPYFALRDYGVEGQIGLEPTPEDYIANLVDVFREVMRILQDDGTLWLNLGDSYAGSNRGAWNNPLDRVKERYSPRTGDYRHVRTGLKPKDLIGIPWRVAFALQTDGWYLRSDIIWSKPNAMPESVTDRPTRAHEYIFLLSKQPKYYYDHETIKEPGVQAEWAKGFRGGAYTGGKTFNNSDGGKRESVGNIKVSDKQRGHSRRHAGFNDRWDAMSKTEQSAMGRNKRDVWTVATRPFSEAHFATFPPDLIEPCVLAGCPEGGIVLDPFNGAGTTGLVATRRNRRYIGIELNPEYVAMSERRIFDDAPLLNGIEVTT